MPPFVPPPEPPALIQSNLNLDVQIGSFSGGTFPSTAKRALPPSSLPPQSGVVEVYYVDPKTLPPSPLNEAQNLSQGSAKNLGAPISVGKPDNFAPNSRLWGIPQKFSLTHLLITQQRNGEVQEFEIPSSPPEREGTTEGETTEAPQAVVGVVEVISDRQEYNSQEQVITARGNVEMRFTNAVLFAERLRVNLPNRVAVAEGNVVLKRGDQVLRGERFEYYFVQDRGVILNANGEIYQPTTGRDFSPSLPSDVGSSVLAEQNLSDRLALNQPLQRVTTGEGYRFVVGGGASFSGSGQQVSLGTSSSGGRINRVRFQADRLDFDGKEWTATNVRFTNDPFSPPELEVRAEKATFRNVAPLVDEVGLTNSEVVFDQSNAIPTFQDQLIIDRRDREPALLYFGYDGEDRGGLYIQRSFNVIDTDSVRWQLSPQYLIQKALSPNSFPQANPTNQPVGLITPSVFGLVSNFTSTFSPRTSLLGLASFSSLDFSDVGDYLRATAQLQQKIGDLNAPHDLRLQYYYRERLFNGSLGYQTVNSSIGVLIVSPNIVLGDTGINLSYQGSIQNIDAPIEQGSIVGNLTRYQGAASLSRSFMLWQGETLPPTPEEGLRYTPTPVQPYLQLVTGLTGVGSFYSDGGSQPSLTGSVGILGQIGHFSRSYLDYTGFNLTYTQGLRGDASPFLFDRFVDTRTLSWGITQQIYGPVRIGVQSSFSFSTNQQISTDYFIEYSRRTYNFLIRYNPILQIGSINLRISDFNWSGNPGTFGGTDIRPVIQGVTRQ